MTSFRFDIGARSRKSGRLIGRVRRELIKALTEEKKTGLTQQELARRLDIRRSVINRQLAGESELTLRSLADLAWALDREIAIELRRPNENPGHNSAPVTSTISYSRMKVIGRSAADDSATPRAASDTEL